MISPVAPAAPLRAAFNPLIRPYLVLQVGLALVLTIVGIPLAIVWFLGVGSWWARHWFDKLECELGPTALRFRKGILFQVEKTIPLENIQDVTFIEGPVLRRFHLAILKFETAGHSAGQASDMQLVGIRDAHEFRAEILRRRQQLRDAHAPQAQQRTEGSQDEVVQVLREILAKVDDLAVAVRERR
ncbi:PH domain-containing protein [Ramlibacter algicola]|uniref:PH domain-containing protein n=1 Tax=Ramlibacter algicola TaxID=2795217 RepID=A0A934US59_9BURK|nr:PH domain-containing protein [Ramlibacter algicola]MBK0394509.1 PH domain-containing protein [Ramlibacter algicola]